MSVRLLHALASLEWGALQLCASEGTLEILMTSPYINASTDELRLKHAIAVALMGWPQVAASLGSTAASALRAYVAAGPFSSQRPRAAVAAPLTL